MKKFISLAILLSTVLCLFCGCSKNAAKVEDQDNSTKQSTTADEEIDISIFPEVEATFENLGTYRKEVSSRTENADGDEFFISEKDLDVIQSCWEDEEVIQTTNVSIVAFNKLYKETSRYYYPVVFRDGNSLNLWYTTDSGSVLLKKLYGYGVNNSNYVGQAHTTEEDVVLENHAGSKIIYNQETGKVDYWSFGKRFETVEVPKGAEYCGHSYFEGYIFRSKSDVYALRTRFFEEGKRVECIAHNVKYVIDASYDFGSDPWSQPLFLMEDGSIKCYVSWEGDESSTPDHSSHLCDLQYEGGYHKGEK